MNAERLRILEEKVHQARARRDNIYEYIINLDKDINDGSFRDNAISFSGFGSFGHEININVQVPQEIISPRKFTSDLYPLNQNRTNFLTDRKYNYLCNFDWYEFTQNKRLPKIYATFGTDLINKSCQTRLSNLWINVFTIVLYLDEFNTGLMLRRLIKWILRGWDGLPFIDLITHFDQVMPGTSTAWPLLFYKYLSVSADFIFGNISEIEAILCFSVGLSQAKDGYQDRKLKCKGGYVSWVKIALNDIEYCVTPQYSPSKEFVGKYMKCTKEIFGENERKEKIQEMRDKVEPIFLKYLEVAIKVLHTIEDIVRLDTICRTARDDRTFYITPTELGIRDAVRPNVFGDVVAAPIPTLVDAFDESMVYEAIYPEGTVMREVQQFYERYYDKLREKIDLNDPEMKFSNFLSTSSAGTKIVLPEDIAKNITDARFSKLLTHGASKRVIQEALLVNETNSMEALIRDITAPILAGVRAQIERRLRLVALLRNAILKLNYSTYIVNKGFSAINQAPSHGKQTGDASDLHDMLTYTTMPDMVISSADVNKLDTSIQINVGKNQPLGAIKILQGKDFDLGPFTSANVNLKDKDGNITHSIMNGAQQMIAFGEKYGSKVTVVESKYFGTLSNEEGTFPSGLLTTSNHHTELLTLVVESTKLAWNRLGNAIALSHYAVLGDDIILYFFGNRARVAAFMDFLVSRLKQIGLELERDESVNVCTFLQQQVINGRFNGFANRISIFTREDHKTRTSVPEACSELNALFDDLLARVYNPVALIRFQRLYAYVTLCKHVMLVPQNNYTAFKNTLSERFKLFEYDPHTNEKKRDMQFLGLMIPYVYFQLYGGGNIPPGAYEKEDGSYTLEYEASAPKGLALRRFLYDLSNSNHINHDIMRKYSIDTAHFLIDTKWLNVREEIRKDAIDTVIIDDLARNLESIEYDPQRNISRRANARLLSLGVRLPANAVYGYQISERIRVILQNIDELPDEVKRTSSKMVDIVINNLKNFRVKEMKGDRHHRYTLIPIESMPLTHTKTAFALSDVSITKSMAPSSSLWKLYVHLNKRIEVGNELLIALSHSQGHFKRFKYDRDTFIHSVAIARKYGMDSNVMTLFFEAVNARVTVRSVWLRAIEYYLQFHEYIYPFHVVPRNLFFLSSDPMSILPLIDESTLPADINARALAIRQCYAYLLSHPSQINNCKFQFASLT